MQPLIGRQMITNPTSSILFWSTPLNSKWEGEFESGGEISVADEELFWYAPQSFYATRLAQYEHRALLTFMHNYLTNVLEFLRSSLKIDRFVKFQNPFRNPNVSHRQHKGLGAERFSALRFTAQQAISPTPRVGKVARACALLLLSTSLATLSGFTLRTDRLASLLLAICAGVVKSFIHYFK